MVSLVSRVFVLFGEGLPKGRALEHQDTSPFDDAHLHVVKVNTLLDSVPCTTDD